MKKSIKNNRQEQTDKEKKPFYKRLWFKIIAGIFVLGVIGNIINPPEETPEKEKTTQTETVKETKENTENTKIQEKVVESENTEKLSPKEQLEEAGKKAFGDEFRKVDAYEDYDNEGAFTRINVELKLGPAFSGKQAVKGFLADSSKFLEQIKDLEYESIFFQVQGDFTDQYGNTSESNAIKMEIEKSEVDKINFDNFDWNNLPNIAKTFHVHQAMGY